MSYVIFLHSYLRYLVLLFGIIVVIQSLVGYMGNGKFKKVHQTMTLMLMICCDLQLLLGLSLYFSNGWLSRMTDGGGMKIPNTRFYGMEHAVGMIIAIVLVHVAYNMTKKNFDANVRHRRIFWCTFIAMLIIIMMIPWQGRKDVGRPNLPALTAA